MKLLKTRLKIKMRHGTPIVDGYMYVDPEGRQLFMHRYLHWDYMKQVYTTGKTYWIVTEATTGVGVTRGNYATRKQAMKAAQETIDKYTKQRKISWHKMLENQHPINTI